MSRIPNPAEIELRGYGRGSVAPGSLGPAPARIGPNAVQGATEYINREYERQLKSEITEANTQLQLGRVEQDSAYDQDNDVDTIEERWYEKMTDHLARSASTITDAEARQIFVQENEVGIEEGRARMREFAFRRKSDQRTAFATEATEIIAKGAIRENADPVRAFDSIRDIWSDMAENGYTSYANAQAQISAGKLVIAESKLKAMEPELRIAALMSEWAQELPADTLAQLRRDAEDELRVNVGQNAAYTALAEGMSLHEANLYFREQLGADPRSVLEANRQYNLLSRDKLQSETQRGVEFYNDFDIVLREQIPNGQYSIAQLKKDHWDRWTKLTPSMRTALERLETNILSPTPRTHSDRGVLAQLLSLWGQGAGARLEAKNYFFSNVDKLNQSDYQDWLEKIVHGQPESKFDAQRQIEALTEGMSARDRANVYNGFNSWYMSFQRENEGAIPSDEQVQKNLFEAVRRRGGRFLSKGKPIHSMSVDARIDEYADLSPEDRDEFLAPLSEPERDEVRFGHLRELDMGVYNDLMEQFFSQGIRNPSYTMFLQDFNDLVEFRRKIGAGEDPGLAEGRRAREEEQRRMQEIEDAAN